MPEQIRKQLKDFKEERKPKMNHINNISAIKLPGKHTGCIAKIDR